MKTHNKIITLQLSVILILMIFLLAYQYIRQEEIKLLMTSDLASNQKIIKNVLDFKAEGFIKPTEDNAAWDGMLDFTKNKDLAWAEENLGGVLYTCDMSYIGAYDTNFKLIYSTCDKIENNIILKSEDIKNWFKNKARVHTYINYDGYIYEIFGAIIVHSWDVNFQSEPHGYLISAKKWDKEFINNLKNASGFNISFELDEQSNINNHNIIKKQLKNYKNQTLFNLYFIKTNTYQSESNMLDNATVQGFIILFISFIIFLFLSNKWIAQPIKSITASLQKGQTKQLDKLTNQKTGFGDIARLIIEFYNQKENLINEVATRKDAEEKLKALLDAVPDDKLIIDLSGNILDEQLHISNILFKSNKPTNIFKDLPIDIAKEINIKIVELKKNEHITPLEFVLTDGEQEKILEARFMLINNDRILLLIRDITDRKLSERELIEAKERAQESDRLKSAFLANLSHEVRTPMNAILGFSKLLEDESITKDEQKEYLDIIKTKGRELMSIFNDIIDISKIASGQLSISESWVNINNLMYELKSFYEKDKIEKEKPDLDIRINLNLDNDNCIVKTDYTRLNQILNNLIGNSLKFTDKGFIEFGYYLKEDIIYYYVEDSGIGITKDKLDIIFERFRQEDENYTRKFGGTGLGLSISKGLVELMGGEIYVESILGSGSKFTFSLPYKKYEDY